MFADVIIIACTITETSTPSTSSLSAASTSTAVSSKFLSHHLLICSYLINKCTVAIQSAQSGIFQNLTRSQQLLVTIMTDLLFYYFAFSSCFYIEKLDLTEVDR